MLLLREREALVSYGRRLRADGLAVGTSGNLSVRSGDRVLITRSGIAYEEMGPGSICVLDLDGGVVEGEAEPSTEFPMHAAAYRATDARAVVHTHSLFATALSTVVDELPPIHYMIAFLGGRVRVAPYAAPGTEELAASMAQALEGRSAVLLQNHGVLTVGRSLPVAYERTVLLEWLCAVYHRARQAGDPRILSEEEVGAVTGSLRGYGPWSEG